MNEITDKLILFLCCAALYLFHDTNIYAIIPMIISVVFSSLFVYYEDNRMKLLGNIIFAVLCVLFPSYICFIPLLLYDIFHTGYQIAAASVPFIILSNIAQYDKWTLSFILIFLLLSYALKAKKDRLNKLTSDYNELRDNSSQMSLLLVEKNQSLLKNQDYEINLATLNERNRISKEIHDNIGHLLSRAILQVGAVLVVAKDEALKEGLTDLKESLSVGMDQIRNSIHNMYDESIDLYSQIDRLVKDFTFCRINYEYDITNPPTLPLKQSLIAITKESLSNIIRHSNATEVSIILREHPAMYQLIIRDNGVLDKEKCKIISNAFKSQEFDEGMGLRNINDRVKNFHGIINVSTEQGFKIFITIPKKAA